MAWHSGQRDRGVVRRRGPEAASPGDRGAAHVVGDRAPAAQSSHTRARRAYRAPCHGIESAAFSASRLFRQRNALFVVRRLAERRESAPRSPPWR